MTAPAVSLLDKNQATAHRIRNFVHSVALVTGIGGVTAFGAWLLWGNGCVIGAFAFIALLLLFGPRISPELVMKLFRARPLDPVSGARLYEVIGELARRAELPQAPKIYLVPSKVLNAFAVGRPEKSSIAVTSGLLDILPDDELVGVLAHEISHIRNNDLWIMGLADTMSRFTQTMSTIGLGLLLYNSFLWLGGSAPFAPWSVAALLYMMPILSSLLQLALSRAREYDADLEAAEITGDPDALARALERLERHQGRIWEDMTPAGRKIAIPSVLRSHPASEERIRRLSQLKLDRAAPPPPLPQLRPDAPIALNLRPLPEHKGRNFPGVRL